MFAVGSFVWSHLNNILKSSIPSRVEVQGLLSDKDLIKKYNNDIRKFSRNYEGSIFFDEYDFGEAEYSWMNSSLISMLVCDL